MFSHYRQEEFEIRLAEKAETTIKLLLEVNEIDQQLLKIIDHNTIHRLYNEKVMIFDENMNLVYSSLDDVVLRWDKTDLVYLKENGSFFRTYNEYDVYGMYFDSQNKDYFALVTAEDKYGKRKLAYLKVLLWAAFGIGTVSSWLLSLYLSKRSLAPLDIFTKQITKITDQNLNIRLPETGKDDEIDKLSRSFNQMISRIDEAYKKQREFAGNASHELRTPISRITTQLENILQNEEINPEIKNGLESIKEEAFHLSDIVISLLLLSRIDNEKPDSREKSFKKIRLDELVFNCISRIKKAYPDLKLHFEIINETSREIDLEIKGDDSLLGIAINNLIKNAFLYSSDQTVICEVKHHKENLLLVFKNHGQTPTSFEKENMFNAFSRGSNSLYKPGSGLGLLIVKRILQYHGAEISFTIPEKNLNCVTVAFKI
jgi:signal transduction histidine kinase